MRVVVRAGLLLVLAGVAAGALPLSGVEPPGLSYVDCGAAVFGRPDPLPAPECSDAYAPLPLVTWAGVVVGAGLVAAGAVGMRLRRP
ncbi:hypothetical protein GCM10008944_07980 [Cytobacillus oceanisediminis]